MSYRCSKCGASYETKRFFCSSCGFGLIEESKGSDESSKPTSPPPVGLDPSSKVERLLAETEDVSLESAKGPENNGQHNVEKSLPSDTDSSEVASTVVSSSTSPVKIKVSYSKEFFEKMVREDEVEFPEEETDPVSLEFLGDEIYIGRKDSARGFNPEIDVASLTHDSAVSTQHAIIRVSANGDLTITDLGSTNGTFIDSVTARPLEAHTPTEIASGSSIFLGAWTAIAVTIQ